MRRVWSRVARPGVLAGALLLLGAASLGDAPDTRASTEDIAAYFVTHRNGVLAAVVLLGAGTIALLGFAVADRARRLDATPDVGGALTVGTAVIAAAVIDAGMVLPYAALAYVVGAEAPSSAKAMFELTLVAAPIVGLPIIVLVASVGWAEYRRHRVTVRFVVSVIAVVALVPSPFSFAEHGAFSPDVQQQIVFNTLVLWLVVGDIARRPS